MLLSSVEIGSRKVADAEQQLTCDVSACLLEVGRTREDELPTGELSLCARCVDRVQITELTYTSLHALASIVSHSYKLGTGASARGSERLTCRRVLRLSYQSRHLPLACVGFAWQSFFDARHCWHSVMSNLILVSAMRLRSTT